MKHNRWADSSSSSSSDDGDDNEHHGGRSSNIERHRDAERAYPRVAEPLQRQHQQDSSSIHNGVHSLHNPLLHGCRLVYETYEQLNLVNEGTYGVVWKAKNVNSNEIVALKQLKFGIEDSNEGFPRSSLREISALLALSHPSIVSVHEIVVGHAPDKVFMVWYAYTHLCLVFCSNF
jgi:cell division cycle 2-like